MYPPALDREVLERIGGSAFFYPCCGHDYKLPLAVFAPWCGDFWFVDLAYFPRQPAEEMRLVLSEKQGYEVATSEIRYPTLATEEWIDDDRYERSPPPIQTETYRHLESGKTIRIHRHKRRGPSALRKEIGRFGVFFYRGDSEEGSGTQWLSVCEWHRPKRRRRWLIHEVLDKLIDGGLIVTDGSMCKGEHNPYREFRRLHCNSTISESEAVASVSPFQDEAGRSFRCVGCLGQHHHYGPTMVWQVTRNPAETA